jgi:hypothetical protein
MSELRPRHESSQEFKDLMEGMDIPCDLVVPAKPPDWLDKDAFFRGQGPML